MDHRKTPAPKALTLPGWTIILSALICLGAAVYYAVLVIGDSNDGAKPVAAATTTAPAPTATPSPTPTPTPTAETTAPKPKPTKPAPTKPAVVRDITVDVFNNTSTSGLARTVAAKVQAAGWSVGSIGNWRGSIPETTVYYPPGFESRAQTLAKDLDFGRMRRAVEPMNMERLTLILSGQQ